MQAKQGLDLRFKQQIKCYDKKAKHKKCPNCFCTAMQFYNSRAMNLVKVENIAKLVPDSIWAFSQKKTQHAIADAITKSSIERTISSGRLTNG